MVRRTRRWNAGMSRPIERYSLRSIHVGPGSFTDGDSSRRRERLSSRLHSSMGCFSNAVGSMPTAAPPTTAQEWRAPGRPIDLPGRHCAASNATATRQGSSDWIGPRGDRFSTGWTSIQNSFPRRSTPFRHRPANGSSTRCSPESRRRSPMTPASHARGGRNVRHHSNMNFARHSLIRVSIIKFLHSWQRVD